MKLDIVGKTIGEAASVLDDAGFSYRVVERDGVVQIVTRDYDNNRVNLKMVEGKIAAYDVG